MRLKIQVSARIPKTNNQAWTNIKPPRTRRSMKVHPINFAPLATAPVKAALRSWRSKALESDVGNNHIPFGKRRQEVYLLPSFISESLTQTELEGKSYWMSQDIPIWSNEPPVVHLLPGFDEFMLGYKDRTATLPQSTHKRFAPAPRACSYPQSLSTARYAEHGNTP